MTTISPTSSPALRPRPVEGQREFHLRTKISSDRPETLGASLAEALERAGARRAEGVSEDVLLTFSPGGSEPCAIHVRVERAEAGTTLSIRVRPDHLHQTNILPPRKIHDAVLGFLEKHRARGAGEPFDLKPHIVSGQDAALALVDHLAGSRALPAVVVTPGPHSEPEALADLARRLAGFATIYSLDALAAQAFVATLGKDRSVFGGAVRVYRPGFTFDADPLDHDLMIVSYLDRRLTNGRTLADEIARRILPEAGEPIAVPTPPAKVRTVPVVEVPRGPTPQERIARLERELDDAREDNEDLREEVRRLNDALRQAKEEIKTLREEMSERRVPTTQIPGIPWALANPHGHPIELADHFADQLQSVARDGSLAAEVHRKMEAVLEAPETYGKDMRGARKGQRACYVANNYRLVWSVSGRTVRFVLVVSKEDPEYSPFGA